MRYILGFQVMLFAAVLLGGCSGRRDVSTARAVVTMTWPERGRLLPRAAESVTIDLDGPNGYHESRLLDRPAAGGTVSAAFTAVPAGEVRVTAAAYPQAGGGGVAQASGTATVTTRAGETATVTLILQSTITRLVVTPAAVTLPPGETRALVVTARDRTEAVVLLSPDCIRWASSNAAVATVDHNGRVTAVADGEATLTVTETESGCTGEAQVSVSTPVVTEGQIAFLSTRSAGRYGLDYDIYIMNTDGSNVRQLTRTTAKENEIAFSPDGRELLFCSDRNGRWDIFRMNADGSNVRQLTGDAYDDWGPTFSADGQKIAYFSTVGGADEVFVMNADGTGNQRLTYHTAFDVLPTFTPDGVTIIFNSNREGQYEVYAMDADGYNLRRLTNRVGDDWYHAISPDGGTIAYTSRDHIRLMDIDGGNDRQLTFPSGYEDARPSYSPDGRQIIFASNRDGQWEVYVMAADGTNQRRLTNDAADDRYPVWGR